MSRVVTDGARKVVFDRFHIVGHMNKALDIVRRRENRALLTDGDTRLVGTKYDFLRGAERVDDNLRQRLVSMRDAGLKTARAWSMKELLRGLWDCKSERRAREWWSAGVVPRPPACEPARGFWFDANGHVVHGTTAYTIAKRSEFVPYDVRAVLFAMNEREPGWGGDSTVGGAPRIPTAAARVSRSRKSRPCSRRWGAAENL